MDIKSMCIMLNTELLGIFLLYSHLSIYFFQLYTLKDLQMTFIKGHCEVHGGVKCEVMVVG